MVDDRTLSPEDFLEKLKYGSPLIGLDVGTKTIGVALSDVLLGVASALETIRRKKFADDADRLTEIILAHSVTGIVIGLPINLDGSEGRRAQSTRAFARNLSALCDLPLMFWDERLSTAAAERTLLAANTSRKRRAQVIDKMAASFILQGALDRLRYLRQHH